MKYAIIAAGEGSRLAQEGAKMPKPLVKVCGETLIGRLIRIFMENDATEILVICNEASTLVSDYLSGLRNNRQGQSIPLRVIRKTTPSSMHSFYELSKYMSGNEPFVLTTVDTVFKEDNFNGYVAELKCCVADGMNGMMGVTDYVDDEKPLFVSTGDNMMITGFHDTENGCRYISGGIYGLTPATIKTLNRCVERGESRMRNFQRALVSEGMRLKAYPFGKVLDVDHVADIAKAEDFLTRQ